MTLTLSQFIDKYANKFVDFDGVYGYQCEDVVQVWNRDGVGAPPLTGNAVDAWHSASQTAYTRIPNGDSNAPAPGDIVIWEQSAAAGTSMYGHIAIAVHGDVHSFVSLDQNWPTGSPCHLQTHTYDGVIGWLHPHIDVVGAAPKPTPPPPPPAPTPDAYAAAGWIGSLQKMTAHVPVAQCAARKAEVLAWLKTHA